MQVPRKRKSEEKPGVAKKKAMPVRVPPKPTVQRRTTAPLVTGPSSGPSSSSGAAALSVAGPPSGAGPSSGFVKPRSAPVKRPSATVRAPAAGASLSTSTPKGKEPAGTPRGTGKKGTQLNLSAIPRPVRRKPVETAPEVVEDEVETVDLEREEGEGQSMFQVCYQENVLLRNQLREEAEERERSRLEKEDLKSQLFAMTLQIDEALEEQARIESEDREEGELLEDEVNFEEEEEEEGLPVDHVGRREWMGQLLRANKVAEEDDKKWVSIPKQRSSNGYLQTHWQTWTTRDLKTDEERVFALLEQYKVIGGHTKTYAELLKGLSDIKLSIIAATNRCNESGKTQPHAAFSSLMLDTGKS